MLTDKNIVITGCNRGIGRAIAEKCMEYRANIWACMRTISEENLQSMRDLEARSHGRIIPVALDLADPESVSAAAKQILSEKVRIDGIVNNAGITGGSRLFSMTSMEEIRAVFEINFFSPMLLTQKLLKNMIRHKAGSIVNISSLAALDGKPAQFGYVSSKAAVLGASRKLAHELGSFGIRVNAIAPGVTETDMTAQMEPGVFAAAVSNSFLKRAGSPADIAEAAAFLLSDRSRYITGETIRVDGGGN